MTVGDKIKAARKEAGMTQAELAKLLGIAGPTLAQWETNVRNPKLRTLAQLAAGLNCSIFYLMDDEDIQAIMDGLRIMFESRR